MTQSLTVHVPDQHKAALWESVKYSGIGRGLKPSMVSPYFEKSGQLALVRVRFDHPTEGKIIRPFHLNEKGQWAMGEPAFNAGKPLLNQQLLADWPEDRPVWLVEGEKSAKALTDAGELAITSGGATSIKAADWSVLAGRDVIAWPDFDDAGKGWLIDAIDALKAAKSVKIVDVDALGLDTAEDVADWLPLHMVDDLKTIRTITPADLLPASEPEDEPSGKESASTLLVAHVLDLCELSHDENGDVFAQLKQSNQAWNIDSSGFKSWLCASYYKAHAKAMRDQAVREAVSVLAGIGVNDGELRKPYVRSAKHGEQYLIDLGDDSWRVIAIDQHGWQILDKSPVLFVRSSSARALPEPEKGGDFGALWECANVPEKDRPLVLAWLLECLRPETPFPLLELTGEQGSAKSTTQTYLRRLIDPNQVNLRAAPRTREDVFISAGNALVVSYENLSHLSAEMQDTFCTLSTGGGMAKRALYKNSDEAIIDVTRPAILNGIGAVVTAQDLASRTILLDLPTIKARATGAELAAKFNEAYPRLFGALLDLFSHTLRELPSVQLEPEKRPRMADFCMLGMAMAKALGDSPASFVASFQANQAGGVEIALDSSPVAVALRDYMETHDSIQDTVANILSTLENFRPERRGSWPQTPRAMGNILRREAPALRTIGINAYSPEGAPRRNGIVWRIERVEQSPFDDDDEVLTV